jgi:hypothetical protein
MPSANKTSQAQTTHQENKSKQKHHFLAMQRAVL